MSVGHAYAFTVLICFAVMIPSGPAYFGMFELGGKFALLLLVTDDQSLALGFTLAVHFLQIIPITITGLFFAFKDHISVKQLQEQQQASETK